MGRSRSPWAGPGPSIPVTPNLSHYFVPGTLGDVCTEIGFGAVTREDEAYQVGSACALRQGIPSQQIRALVGGDEIRDWQLFGDEGSIWPYNPDTLEAYAPLALVKMLWPSRTILSQRVAYGSTQIERGLKWFEYSMFFKSRFQVPLSIAFAAVTSSNHFVLDRGGKAFKQSAPIIKFPDNSGDEDHLGILGVLNSSTAFFWMTNVFQAKGGSGVNQGVYEEAWEQYYDISGTGLKKIPLPETIARKSG